MPAPSLSKLAQKACIRSLPFLTEIGDIPYDVIRPVLLKLDDAEQLKNLETKSPQLVGVDQEIWIGLIKRHFGKIEGDVPYPEDPMDWSLVYDCMFKEHQEEKERNDAALADRFSAIRSEKAKHQSRGIQGTPTIPMTYKMKINKNLPHNTTKKPIKKSSATDRLPACIAGSGIVKKMGRAAVGQNLWAARNKMAVPTHQLKSVASRVMAVPQHLIDDHKKPVNPPPLDPTIPTPKILIPKGRSARNDAASLKPSPMTLEERERRLKALKNAKMAEKSVAEASSAILQKADTVSASSSPSPPQPTSERLRSSLTSTTVAMKKPATSTNNSQLTAASATPGIAPTSKTGTTVSKSGPVSTLISASGPSSKQSSSSSTLKRKAEDQDVLQSIESDHSPVSSVRKRYVPHIKTPSPEARALAKIKKRAEASPFIPVKRRKVA